MNKFHLSICIFLFIVSVAVPLYAQNATGDKQQKSEQPFIQKRTFLTGFSFGFTNASTSDDVLSLKETTNIVMQINGLYFLNKHFGVGPLLAYQFIYNDYGSRYNNITTRGGQWGLGAQVGYYIPVSEIFGGSSRTNFFINAGIEGFKNYSAGQKSVYEYGFQAETGFLFPVGKRIAIQTQLGYFTRRRKYELYTVSQNKSPQVKSIDYKWPSDIELSVGLMVTF